MAKRKFNRVYELKIETNTGEVVTIKPPFTCEFSIMRNLLSSTNTGSFVIKNLAPKTRAKLFKDQFDTTTFRPIQFFAGYDDGTSDNPILPMVFNGNIKKAYNFRQGTEFVTEIECFDGSPASYQNVSTTIKKGTPLRETFKTLVDSMTSVESFTQGEGNDQTNFRDQAIFGNAKEIIDNQSNGKFYIDSGGAYLLRDNEVLEAPLTEISFENGLINTPRRQELFVEIDMLFEPRCKPSQKLNLISTSEPQYNGVYKLVGFTHSGVISEAVAGMATTKMTLRSLPDFKVVKDMNSPKALP